MYEKNNFKTSIYFKDKNNITPEQAIRFWQSHDGEQEKDMMERVMIENCEPLSPLLENVQCKQLILKKQKLSFEDRKTLVEKVFLRVELIVLDDVDFEISEAERKKIRLKLKKKKRGKEEEEEKEAVETIFVIKEEIKTHKRWETACKEIELQHSSYKFRELLIYLCTRMKDWKIGFDNGLHQIKIVRK